MQPQPFGTDLSEIKITKSQSVKTCNFKIHHTISRGPAGTAEVGNGQSLGYSEEILFYTILNYII